MRFPVIAMDPRFGGGQRSLTAAFWQASVSLGHEPSLLYLSRARGLSPRMRGPRLRVTHEEQSPFHGKAVPSVLPELDGVNQFIGGERIARRIEQASQAWVVAGGAPYGWGALRSGLPYGCWLASGVADEWQSRRDHLGRSRRAAMSVSAPLLFGMERKVIRGARFVATISGRSRDALSHVSGIDPDDIAVWPVPVDVDVFTPLDDPEWERGLETPTIVFVGRAGDPRKNVALLAEAFPKIRQRLPTARLRFVGQPPSDEVIRRAGPGAEVVGEIRSIPDAIRDAALLVLPSFQEGFGIVVAEAFACGVPAVVTPSGGPEELVRGSGAGVVLEGWDNEELAEAVAGILDDREHLRELRRAARPYVVSEYSVARLRDLVADAIAGIAIIP